MASAFGVNGTISRCYPAFQNFLSCTSDPSKTFQECKDMAADYQECLWHEKANARTDAINKERKRRGMEPFKSSFRYPDL